MTCGSTALTKIAKVRGWEPGSFLNENHDFRQWKLNYGEHLLNNKAEVSSFGRVALFWEEFFIRPCEDNKTFSGMITTWENFIDWRKRVIDLKETYTTLDANTMVCYGPLKNIYAEYRFFVIDGKIITHSQYKIGSRVAYNAVVEDAVVAFAQKMIDLWQPARGFVIDIGQTDEGYKIIEINCLNSAGFYASNVPKLVEAIENMEYGK